MSATTEYRVEGMTCDHCVRAVREEVGAVPGVVDVEVLLEGGRLVVTSDGPPDADAVGAAVEEAGYALAGPAS